MSTLSILAKLLVVIHAGGDRHHSGTQIRRQYKPLERRGDSNCGARVHLCLRICMVVGSSRVARAK